MKKIFKHIKFIVAAAAVSSALCGCEDVLDTKTTYEIYDKDIWRIPELSEGVLMEAYSAIPGRMDHYGGNNFLDCATDNALTRNYASDVYGVSMGGITASSNPFGNWASGYNQLQNVNIFLEKGLVDGILYNRVDADIDAEIKTRLKGEAFFLRAWWHFQLLKQYGGKSNNGIALGIPLADHFIEQEEAADFSKFTRATYKQTVDFILNDLNSAIELLPGEYFGNDEITGDKHIGRADDRACQVLKANVLLYGASPAYQDDAIVKINGMGDYTIVDEAAYQNICAEAAIAINDILLEGWLGTFNSLKPTDIADAANNTPSEIVFRRFFRSKAVEYAHFPPFYFGDASTIPSHNLVKAFFTKSGYPQGHANAIDWNANDPYNNLDNRFLKIIYHHGRVFGNSGVELDLSPKGKDSPQFEYKGSRSGYYLAKFVSGNADMLTPTLGSSSAHYYPLLRKAEVYMAFAELANEAWGPEVLGPGCFYTAYDVIREVRQKSGGITDETYLKEMALSKEDFRALIQNERRLEFAFENHRYFDMRRCLLPLNEDILGVEVAENGEISEKVLEPRLYEVRHYYAPLPYAELQKNKDLVNNLGW